MAANKIACEYFGAHDEFWVWKPHMLALAGRLLMHVWSVGIREHIGGTAGKRMVRPLFLLHCGSQTLILRVGRCEL